MQFPSYEPFLKQNGNAVLGENFFNQKYLSNAGKKTL